MASVTVRIVLRLLTHSVSQITNLKTSDHFWLITWTCAVCDTVPLSKVVVGLDYLTFDLCCIHVHFDYNAC